MLLYSNVTHYVYLDINYLHVGTEFTMENIDSSEIGKISI